LSGLPDDDELGASMGALAMVGELSLAIGPSDFLVPLAVDLAFGPDMAVNRAKKNEEERGVRVRVRVRIKKYS